ncbi:hypothetical protein EXE09_00690 [Acinetobacter sp. WCHAc060025]|nr:hypothetical protein EXE09_00690 [Acinetobacter sp. WCHAc060025]
MNFKILKPLSVFTLCFCVSATNVFASEKVLQSIDNLDNEDVHTDEGNYFKLIRIEQGCRIEAKLYLSNQQHIYNYYFNNQTLYKATRKTFQYRYKKGEEGSLGAVTGIYQSSSEVYPLTDAEMLKRYKYFKSLFPSTYLKQCT